MIGLESYDNRTKETWRGWAWNQLRARITDQKRRRISDRQAAREVESATVLYLPGPDDFDRDKGITKGFNTTNLIGVDIVPTHVAHVRQRGGLAIQGKLDDILVCWPDDWPIDGIVADLCGGMNHNALATLIAMLVAPGKGKAACVINVLRGRDAWSKWWRDKNTHRSTPIQAMLFYAIISLLGNASTADDWGPRGAGRLYRAFDSEFYSYPTPSTHVPFDSMAFTVRSRLSAIRTDRIVMAECAYQMIHRMKNAVDKGLKGKDLSSDVEQADFWATRSRWLVQDSKNMQTPRRLHVLQRRLAALRARRTQLINASDPDQAIAHKGTPERMLNELCYR